MMNCDKHIDYTNTILQNSGNNVSNQTLRKEIKKIGPYLISFIVNEDNNDIEIESIEIDKNFISLKEFTNNTPYIDTSNIYDE